MAQNIEALLEKISLSIFGLSLVTKNILKIV